MDSSITIKISLVGKISVGKTSLSKAFNNEDFKFNSIGEASTIGAAYIGRRIILDNQEYHLKLWDTAGSERFKSLIPIYLKGADVVFICFDSTIDGEIEEITSLLPIINHNAPEYVKIFLVYLKSDLKELLPEQERSILDKFRVKMHGYDLEIYKTSSFTGKGIKELFSDTALVRSGSSRKSVGIIGELKDTNADIDNRVKMCCSIY